MDRIGTIRTFVIDILKTQAKNEGSLQAAYAHLYGVSYMTALIAAKRGANVELATIAGMLHDIASFILVDVTSANHAEKSTVLAMEYLLDINITSLEETEIICDAIKKHSDKMNIDSLLYEVLKDADVLAHGLFNVPNKNFRTYRWNDLCKEFGLQI